MVTIILILMALFALAGGGLVISLWSCENEKVQAVFAACTALCGYAAVISLIIFALGA